jgi:hypothetical protein
MMGFEERLFSVNAAGKWLLLGDGRRGFIALDLYPPGLCTGGEPLERLPHLAV